MGDDISAGVSRALGLTGRDEGAGAGEDEGASGEDDTPDPEVWLLHMSTPSPDGLELCVTIFELGGMKVIGTANVDLRGPRVDASDLGQLDASTLEQGLLIAMCGTGDEWGHRFVRAQVGPPRRPHMIGVAPNVGRRLQRGAMAELRELMASMEIAFCDAKRGQTLWEGGFAAAAECDAHHRATYMAGS